MRVVSSVVGTNLSRRTKLRPIFHRRERPSGRVAGHNDFRYRHYSSLFRSSVVQRLRGSFRSSNSSGPRTNAKTSSSGRGSELPPKGDAMERQKIEMLVRDRLRREFPHAFGSLWHRDKDEDAVAPLATLSAFRTLLALNGFSAVATPKGNARLYLAEGVVATPPQSVQLSPSFSFVKVGAKHKQAYQELSEKANLDNVGVFGDVHHLLAANPNHPTTDRLFAQPVPSPSAANLHPRQRTLYLPDLVHEDLTIYRVLEKAAARVLDRTYSGITGWIDQRFVKPLTSAKYRTRVAIKRANKFRARIENGLERSLADRAWEGFRGSNRIGETTPERIDRTKSTDGSSNVAAADTKADKAPSSSDRGESRAVDETSEEESSPTESGIGNAAPTTTADCDTGKYDEDNHTDDENEEQKEDPLETLVAISSRDDDTVESVSLYRKMTPTTRILALPDYYVLRHSSASTLVSVSLVVFGALPVANRSYNWSIEYDWLVGSEWIAALSVMGTISYSIFIGRQRARTSQSKIVHEGLAARVGARDEAALLLLREGAVRAVLETVLDTGRSASSNGDGSTEAAANGLFDARDWAIGFGLLPPNGSGDGIDEDAVPSVSPEPTRRGKGHPKAVTKAKALPRTNG